LPIDLSWIVDVIALLIELLVNVVEWY